MYPLYGRVFGTHPLSRTHIHTRTHTSRLRDLSVRACAVVCLLFLQEKLLLPAAGVHVILPDHFSPDRMGLIVPETKDGRVVRNHQQ